MQELSQLIEDYKRRIISITDLIRLNNSSLISEAIVRLNTKLHCYETFISELEKLKK